MAELLTRCGYRCDLCLAFKKNIEKNDMRQKLSVGWSKCFGFTISPDQIYCEGCLTSGTPILIDKDCPVRPCVIEKKLANCSECDEYPCDKLRQRLVVYEVIALNKDLSNEERELYVKPYENKVRLDQLRGSRNEEK